MLIAGPGDDILDGNNAYLRNGKTIVAGKTTYVLRSNCGKTTIYGFTSGRDKIYLDPEKGVDADGLAEAIKNAEVEKVPGTNFIRPGNWVIKAGDLLITVNTANKEKPKVSDFVLAEWKPGK